MTASVNPIQDFFKSAAPLMAGPMMPEEGQEGPAGQDTDFHEQLLDMERQIELEKKKQELANIQQKTFEMMNPQPEPQMSPEQQQQMPQEGMPQDQGAAPPDMGQEQEQMPPDYAFGPQMKVSSAHRLMDEAIGLSKTASPLASLVVEDLRLATDFERIKKATADRGRYPEANPYGDIFRLKQKLAALTEDALHAKDKNEMLLKEAEDAWVYQVKQHLLGGGDIGEVAHVIETVDSRDERVKYATALLSKMLNNSRFDGARMTAQSLVYEMEKGASHRVLNPDNPLVQSYGALTKVADGQDTLAHAYRDLQEQLTEVETLIKGIVRQC